jgi:hypothetical protein
MINLARLGLGPLDSAFGLTDSELETGDWRLATDY